MNWKCCKNIFLWCFLNNKRGMLVVLYYYSPSDLLKIFSRTWYRSQTAGRKRKEISNLQSTRMLKWMKLKCCFRVEEFCDKSISSSSLTSLLDSLLAILSQSRFNGEQFFLLTPIFILYCVSGGSLLAEFFNFNLHHGILLLIFLRHFSSSLSLSLSCRKKFFTHNYYIDIACSDSNDK